MAKTFLAICVLLSISCALKAQQSISRSAPANPFLGMQFNNTYKDTITMSAMYTGEHGKTSDNNRNTLKQIDKLYGINVSKFENAIGFKFKGFGQNFYVPYRKNNASAMASVKPNTLLTLKCTVYRFFTIDGIANFFYIDKVL